MPNQGHLYDTGVSDADRRALVEYNEDAVARVTEFERGSLVAVAGDRPTTLALGCFSNEDSKAALSNSAGSSRRHHRPADRSVAQV
jgi:hypothetical protein